MPEKIEMAKVYGIPRTGALINYLRQEKFPTNGYVEGPSSLDGPNYLNAFRRLEHFPITLFIAMPMSDILTGWWNKVKVPYILTVVLLIGGFLISQWTLRQEHTREKERRHASEILSESETWRRKLFELNSAVKLMIDPDNGNIVDANKAASEYYGWPIDQLKQMQIQEINTLSPEDVRKEIEKTISSGSLRLEFQHRKADGSIRDVEVFSSKIEISGKTFLYSIIHDISDRKQISEALQESEANLKLLLNTVPIPVFYKDIEGRYIGFNKAFETFLGKSKEQLVGKSLFDISPPELAKVYHAQDVELFEKPGIQVYESQVRDSNNVLHNVIFHKASLINTQGSINGLIGAIIDITERKQVEAEKAELEVQNRQLQKAESLGRMAGAIAHHFNNQLYAVMGNLEMAMDDLPRGADISETLAEANKAAHKAAEVSRLMLTYLGQTPGKHEPIDLSEAYRKSLTLLLAAAPKGMILNADFPSSGPIINADAGQMQQILTNLITNAWESIYSNQDTIALTVKMVSHADIPTSKRFPIDWQPQKIAYACLEVSDTGCGITNKDIEKLFDPFFTTKFTGRGLGLPVVMGIVKAHDGGITVKSEPGHGSVFRVFLPISTEELPIQHDLPVMSEALRTGKTEKISKIEGGGTVLLIEDEEQVRNMAKIMLTRLGYTVLEAKDGIEAVEIFQLHQDEIRCVLSDLTMPRMDGWETLSALRKLSPDIPVILSSGYDEAQVMAGEHPERPNAFLSKPYQLKGLSDTISRVLANKAQGV